MWQIIIMYSDTQCINTLTLADYYNIPAKIAAFVPRGENPGRLDESYWQNELKLVRII